MLPKKRKNAQILLKSQDIAQDCWKVRILAANSKKCQGQSGHAYSSYKSVRFLCR